MRDEHDPSCPRCGAELPAGEVGTAVRCSSCGSQVVRVGLAVEMDTATRIAAYLTRPWESNTLTLAGVLYGIVVTVIGVLVATTGTVVLAIYCGASLVLLLLGLTVFQQAVIGATRRLLKPRVRFRDWYREWRRKAAP